MAKKKKNIIIKQGLDDWVMTYGDMMSLLLTFFVLIVSFSSMQETKFNQAAASLADAFGVMASPESVIEFNQPIVPNHAPTDEESEVLYEVRSVEKMLLEEGFDSEVEVQVNDDGVLFRVNAPFMFDSGGVEISKKSARVLDRMAKFFRKFPYPVHVEGHTDSDPISSSRFPTNWELSAARAVTVARYFQGTGMPPDQIAATGYGEFRPISGNDTVKGRAKNRRVEIFLHIDKAELARSKKLPFVGAALPVQQPEAQTDENAPARQIINPVTGRLGSLTGQKTP